MWCNLDSWSSLRTLWSAVIMSTNHSAIFVLSARLSEFLLYGALVIFVRLHTSLFGSFEKWVRTLWFLPALFEVGFAGRCPEGEVAVAFPRQLERRLSNLTNPCSSFSGWSLSGWCVSTCSSWSPRACASFRSPRALVWWSAVCKTGTAKGMWLSVFHSMFYHSWWDMMFDSDAIHTNNLFLRTIVQIMDVLPLLLLSYASYYLQSWYLTDLSIFELFLVLLESNHQLSSPQWIHFLSWILLIREHANNNMSRPTATRVTFDLPECKEPCKKQIMKRSESKQKQEKRKWKATQQKKGENEKESKTNPKQEQKMKNVGEGVGGIRKNKQKQTKK